MLPNNEHAASGRWSQYRTGERCRNDFQLLELTCKVGEVLSAEVERILLVVVNVSKENQFNAL